MNTTRPPLPHTSHNTTLTYDPTRHVWEATTDIICITPCSPTGIYATTESQTHTLQRTGPRFVRLTTTYSNKHLMPRYQEFMLTEDMPSMAPHQLLMYFYRELINTIEDSLTTWLQDTATQVYHEQEANQPDARH